MLGSSGLPVFPIDVVSGRGVDVSRQGTSFRFDLDDHAIVTGGSGSLFTVSTELGDTTLKRGLGLVILASRSFFGTPRLQVDDTAAKPWLDVEGQPLARVVADRLYRVTYDAVLDAFRSDSPTLVENDDLALAPADTIKGNAGEGNADLTAGEARVVLALDRVANKSEADMVASGPIADALSAKLTPEQLDASLTTIRTSLNSKASTKYVDDSVSVISTGFAALQEDFGELDDEVEAIRTGQNSGVLIVETWAQLAAITPTLNAKAEIPGTATTTHADPVATGNPTVPDPGLYRGSTSPLGWKRVGPTTAAAAADAVGSAITVSPLTRAAALQLAFRDPDTNRLTVLSPADSAAFIQEIAVPTTYPTDLTDVVLTETSSVILGEDAQRSGDLLIQIIDKADAGFNFSTNAAVLDVPGTWGQKSGQWINHGDVGTGAISGVVRRTAGDGGTDPLSVKVNVRVRRRVKTPLPSKLADSIFVRWTDPADSRLKDVIRAEVDYLFGLGILQKLRVWFLPTASMANSMVNLADPNGPLFLPRHGASGTIEFQPYKFMRGNGSDQFVDTQRVGDALGMTLNSHFLAAKIFPGGGVDSNGFPAGNSVNYGIQPNRRSDGLYGFRSGSGLETNEGALRPINSWAALNRDPGDPGNLIGFIDEEKIFTRARALAALPTRNLNILSAAGTSGGALFSPLPVHGVLAGFGLADLSAVRLIQSNKRIQAVMATIAGA